MEINWNKITLDEKETIDKYYKEAQSRSCEDTFANNFLWAPHYHTRYALVEDTMVFFSEGEGASVSFPHGSGDLKKAMEVLMTYFEERELPFQMTLVTPEQFAQLEEIFPGKFQVEYDRDYADYIYESEKLITLAGKKLHSKRNHINNFMRDNTEWSYEPINESNKKDCIEMANEWRIESGCDGDAEKEAEFCVTLNALKHMEVLGLKGGILRIVGKVVAFTLGEECCEDTFVVHIEKAFASVQGAYPMINQQFVKAEGSTYQYINREEDTGAEGLRKAKLSYKPVFLQEKGFVTFK